MMSSGRMVKCSVIKRQIGNSTRTSSNRKSRLIKPNSSTIVACYDEWKVL